MKKKHWIIGLIVIGIIIISFVLCQVLWKNDEKLTENHEDNISGEKLEDETEFLPSYDEEEEVSKEPEKPSDKTATSGSTNVQDGTNTNKNETIVPSDTEETNDSDENDKVDNTKNEEEQESGSDDEDADKSSKELPFVPFN